MRRLALLLLCAAGCGGPAQETRKDPAPAPAPAAVVVQTPAADEVAVEYRAQAQGQSLIEVAAPAGARVDDQLAHPDHGGGQGRLSDQQDDHPRRERARGLAHQSEGARQVPEILQGEARALAERLRRRRESHQCSSISCTLALSSR